jgi:hypothetical protein
MNVEREGEGFGMALTLLSDSCGVEGTFAAGDFRARVENKILTLH